MQPKAAVSEFKRRLKSVVEHPELFLEEMRAMKNGRSPTIDEVDLLAVAKVALTSLKYRKIVQAAGELLEKIEDIIEMSKKNKPL